MKDASKLEKSAESRHTYWDVFEIKRMFDEGNLVVQEDFQRRDVWDNPRKSKLIESMLRCIPIPSIYVEEVGEGGKYIVIDGQQRINSIIQYLNEEFGLSGSSILDDLKNKKYNNIKGIKGLNARFRNEKIPVIIITNSANKELKYEIFERLNTGAVKLNNQELRNCMYHGNYNDLIKNELAVHKDFEYLLGGVYDKFHKRMKDAELVLRFFAFSNNEEDYKPPMKRFLNREMESPEEKIKKLNYKQIEEFKNLFEKCVRLTKEVFGKNAFRKFDMGSDKEVNGKWNKQLNTALFDVEMCGFAPYMKGSGWVNEDIIIQCKDAIYEELIYMMTQDNDFRDVISSNRNYEKDKVHRRFREWKKALYKIIENQDNSFSLETKKGIYKDDPDCCICGKRIQDFDDAEIYGVKCYWRGETIPINSRLAHRYCNSQVTHTSSP